MKHPIKLKQFFFFSDSPKETCINKGRGYMFKNQKLVGKIIYSVTSVGQNDKSNNILLIYTLLSRYQHTPNG